MNDHLLIKWCFNNWASKWKRNEFGPLSYTTHKDQLEVCYEFKCEKKLNCFYDYKYLYGIGRVLKYDIKRKDCNDIKIK